MKKFLLLLVGVGLGLCIIQVVNTSAASKQSRVDNLQVLATTVPARDLKTLVGAPAGRTSASVENADDCSIRKIIKVALLNLTLQFERIISEKMNYNQNVLFAPVNIVGVLATLLLGAESGSESKSEILKALGLQSYSNNDNIHSVLSEFLSELLQQHKTNPAVIIEFAKAIFIQEQQEAQVQKEFKDLAKKYYENEIISLDFFAPNNKAVDFINNWVSNHTRGRISDLIQAPLSPNTKLILTNILFFNGEWKYPFFYNTTWNNFFTDDGVMKVKMMVNRSPAYTYDNYERKYSVLGLAYKGDNTIMYLILPYQNQSLKTILGELTVKDLNEIAANSTQPEEEVTYVLPYMNLNEEVNLKKVLQKVGVQRIFDPQQAQLAKIAADVFVSEAVHKVNLDITEAGSTGAAATSLSIETRFPTPHMYIFNRPFAFYIYHRSTSIVTFWATVNLPLPNKIPETNTKP